MNYWDVHTYEDFRQFAGPDMVSDSREEDIDSEPKREGMVTISLKNWRLLEPLLYTMVKMSHAIFRGVQHSHFTLTPSIFRRFILHPIEKENTYIERCYGHFLEAICGRRGSPSKPLDTYSKFEIWSLGRHFGVSNTMLDWSYSPFVCLFFAFARHYEKGVRSLYCLKRNIIEAARDKKTGIESVNRMENPLQIEHQIRSLPNTQSDNNRTVDPLLIEHFFGFAGFGVRLRMDSFSSPPHMLHCPFANVAWRADEEEREEEIDEETEGSGTAVSGSEAGRASHCEGVQHLDLNGAYLCG